MDKAIEAGIIQDLEYAVVRGQKIPIQVVPMEGWRQRSKPVDAMDIFKRGRWSEAQVAQYLEAVRDPRQAYWHKFYIG